MRNTPRILAAIGIVMIIVIAYRFITGGPLGPKSYAFIGVTAAVWAAAAITAIRAPRTTTTTTAPRV